MLIQVAIAARVAVAVGFRKTGRQGDGSFVLLMISYIVNKMLLVSSLAV